MGDKRIYMYLRHEEQGTEGNRELFHRENTRGKKKTTAYAPNKLGSNRRCLAKPPRLAITLGLQTGD